jgi:ribosome recycling factor
MDAEERMIKSEQAIVNEFANVRTGKASAGLVENIQAEIYGSMMRIRELANISSPEPRMLVVTPWDVAALQPIEKAIQKANIGLSPVVQGKLLRLSFPELSTERRQEFVKLIKKMAEDARVSVRHIRRDAMDLFKKHAHDSGITEDGKKQAEKDLQKLTDDYTGKIDAHVAHKEKEIMTV